MKWLVLLAVAMFAAAPAQAEKLVMRAAASTCVLNPPPVSTWGLGEQYVDLTGTGRRREITGRLTFPSPGYTLEFGRPVRVSEGVYRVEATARPPVKPFPQNLSQLEFKHPVIISNVLLRTLIVDFGPDLQATCTL